MIFHRVEPDEVIQAGVDRGGGGNPPGDRPEQRLKVRVVDVVVEADLGDVDPTEGLEVDMGFAGHC